MTWSDAEVDRRITEALQATADAVEAGRFSSAAPTVDARVADAPVQWLGDVTVAPPARRRRQRYLGVAVVALACCALVFVSLALLLDRGGRSVPPARPTTDCSSSVSTSPPVPPSVSPSVSPPGSEPSSPSVIPTPSTSPGEPTCTPSPAIGSDRTSVPRSSDAGPS